MKCQFCDAEVVPEDEFYIDVNVTIGKEASQDIPDSNVALRKIVHKRCAIKLKERITRLIMTGHNW